MSYTRRSRWSFSIGAKSQLASTKSRLDEAMDELLFVADKGISEEEYNQLVDLLEGASHDFYELDAETGGFWGSLMNYNKSKRVKEQAKHVHRRVMLVSDATKRGIGKQRNSQHAHRAFEEVQPVVDQTQSAPPQLSHCRAEQSTPSPEASTPQVVVNVQVNLGIHFNVMHVGS
ncbi:hypothetical protein PC9H_010741 [Pleurotus ostreatus]|uniref:Uncharacterized protein n=2 Tax=Pleurotus TaxID=5320 RepID=A0A8H6ZKF1_PLEOS|nr:uncharacterized protein PC9H_010741 [Pleurotus ostreatus]KAF7422585.1 hypothetical protein PC9H_010741 [Pleurotus ostreatus]KAG9227554.1 hypothetical protein CCMSSC00406_0000800 [Pleurotus cornucopiae]